MSNCNSNGSFFKQLPYHCPYSKSSLNPNRLIKDEVSTTDLQETEETDDEQSTLIHGSKGRLYSRKCKIISTLACMISVSLIAGMIVAQTNTNDDSYIFIATGYPFELSFLTEIVHLNNHHFQCKNVPQYPLKVRWGAAALIDGIPLICGVLFLQYSWTDVCYMLDEVNKTWILSANNFLRKPRADMGTGNLLVQNKLLFSGGLTRNFLTNDTYVDFESSNYLMGWNATATDMPDMPYAVARHCIVQINETYFIATGGTIGFGEHEQISTHKTFFYNIKKENWTSGPNLNINRTQHGCAKVILGILGNKTIVIVSGGYGRYGNAENHSTSKSVEFLDLSKSQAKWIIGKSLPVGFIDHVMVCASKTVYITGLTTEKNSNTSIMELKCPDNSIMSCHFVKSQVQMLVPRRGHIALPISSKIVKRLCQ